MYTFNLHHVKSGQNFKKMANTHTDALKQLLAKKYKVSNNAVLVHKYQNLVEAIKDTRDPHMDFQTWIVTGANGEPSFFNVAVDKSNANLEGHLGGGTANKAAASKLHNMLKAYKANGWIDEYSVKNNNGTYEYKLRTGCMGGSDYADPEAKIWMGAVKLKYDIMSDSYRHYTGYFNNTEMDKLIDLLMSYNVILKPYNWKG